MSVDLLDRHQVCDGRHHAADLRAVLLDDGVVHPLQAQGAQRLLLVALIADARLRLGDLQACHEDQPPCPARARSMPAGATSSSGRPRRAATSSGRTSSFSAATVACTMLIGLSEPRDLESTSWMPAHSSTVRTGPPAMTPVPGLAGFRNTPPAAFSPCTGCGIVAWIRGTLKKFFLASSTPLAIAAGTSLALPYPTPTVPSPSPTTTRAVKLNRRPPLTTFATRLMVTTRSRCGLFSGAPPSRPPRPPSRRSRRCPSRSLPPVRVPRWGPGLIRTPIRLRGPRQRTPRSVLYMYCRRDRRRPW